MKVHFRGDAKTLLDRNQDEAEGNRQGKEDFEMPGDFQTVHIRWLFLFIGKEISISIHPR